MWIGDARREALTKKKWQLSVEEIHIIIAEHAAMCTFYRRALA